MAPRLCEDLGGMLIFVAKFNKLNLDKYGRKKRQQLHS